MFWGVTLKARKKYSQTLQKAFHLSQAALDIKSCNSDEPIQLILNYDNTDYVLCTLRRNKVEQVALEMCFDEGEEIAFISQGPGNIHLTGYMLPTGDEDFGDEETSSEDEGMAAMLGKKLAKYNKLEEGKNGDKKLNLKRKVSEAEEEDEDDSDFDLDGEDEDVSMEEGSEDGEGVEEESEEEEGEDEEEDDEEETPKQPKAKQPKLDQSAKIQQNGVAEPKKKDKKNKQKEQQKPEKQQQKGGEKVLQGGVKIEDVRVGNGPEAKPGKKVVVYYEGRLKQNNKVFDSTKIGPGFKFSLGKGQVIKGWDIGVAGMKVGGKRRITCPPHMAYGQKGSPPVIPPNSTLVFDVELKGVN